MGLFTMMGFSYNVLSSMIVPLIVVLAIPVYLAFLGTAAVSVDGEAVAYESLCGNCYLEASGGRLGS